MNRETEDYYELLGVPRDAGQAAIKHAFRSRARELHPDVSADPAATERFTALAKAYKVLSRPATRLLYDRYGYLGRGNGGFGPTQKTPAGSERPPESFVAQVEVDLAEAVRGATRKIQVTSVGICTTCRGEGAAPGSRTLECRGCAGRGRVQTSSELGAARLLQIEICRACGGRGRVIPEPCPDCDGMGRAKDERTGLVRYAAAATVAIALFVVLLVAPEALVGGL